MSGYKNIDPNGGNTFSSTNQPSKRRGPDTIVTRVRRLLRSGKDYIVFKNAERLNKRTGEPIKDPDRFVDVRVPVVNLDALVHQWLEMAMVDKEMFKFLVNHESGKPVEATKLESDDRQVGAGFEVVIVT